jgi:hypothetical protein
MTPILFLLTVTITFRPVEPTVGDLVTVEAKQANGPIVLDPSPQFEEVSRRPGEVVIRSFEPKALTLSGTAGDERFSGVVIPMKSVLKKGDAMEPAPLAPPQTIPYPRGPFVAIGATALAAILAWLGVFALARRLARKSAPVPVLTPLERFHADVAAANGHWAALADATRQYLAGHGYGAELTTRELLAVLPDDIRAIAVDVLREGDLDKFSPWGSSSPDFNTTASRALTLADLLEPKPEEEAA